MPPFLIRALLLLALISSSAFAQPVLKVLFLGDNGHHQPASLLRHIGPVMMNRGIQLVYTEDVDALTLDDRQ